MRKTHCPDGKHKIFKTSYSYKDGTRLEFEECAKCPYRKMLSKINVTYRMPSWSLGKFSNN